MTGIEVIKSILKATGKTQRDLAEMVGTTPQKISGPLKRSTLRASTMLQWAGMLGVQLRIFNRDGLEVEVIDMESGTSYIDAVAKDLGMTTNEIGKTVGYNDRQIHWRVNNDSVMADDFLLLMEKLGVAMRFEKYENGERVDIWNKGKGRHVFKMVDTVKYDTNRADALGNDFYGDGVNQYQTGVNIELYRDDAGRYFVAEYHTDDGERDTIRTMSRVEARKLEKQLNKKKKS